MQPTKKTAGDPKIHGPLPGMGPGDLSEGHLNGGTAPALQELLHALQAMRVGDFSVRMEGGHVGQLGKIADTFNEIVAANERMAKQLERVGQVGGREG